MNSYTIRELANQSSYREGYTAYANTLADAKRMAVRKQAFHGTVLTIEDETGFVMSTRIARRWRDQ